LGVDHIDTSDAYGPHVANELIREALHPYREFTELLAEAGFAIADITLLDERLGAIAAIPTDARPDTDPSAKKYLPDAQSRR
jgi:aryl-alcohol dehydrogenase-like predicted oxidoreductase